MTGTLERLDRMDAEMEEARAIGRDAIYRVVVLSAAIVGFSATLLSLEAVDFRIDESRLRLTWLLLAVVIVLGPVSVYLESRAKYAISWRAIQAQEFDQDGPSDGERAKLLAVLAYTVSFARGTSSSSAIRTLVIRERRGSTDG